MGQSSDVADADGPPAPLLQLRAGGCQIALSCRLARAVEQAAVPRALVPGAAPWLLGLIQWQGGLLTLVDAGRLFGSRPCLDGRFVVLKGLDVDVALAVDEILPPDEGCKAPDLVLDQAALACHPAFQPGAAVAPLPKAPPGAVAGAS